MERVGTERVTVADLNTQISHTKPRSFYGAETIECRGKAADIIMVNDMADMDRKLLHNIQ